MAKAQAITWSAKWLPPPKRGKPRQVNNVPAERGVAIIVEGLHEYSQSVQDEAKAILTETAGWVQRGAVENLDANDTNYIGKLRQSVRVDAPNEWTRTISAGGATAPYAPFVEFGTRSGAPSIEKIEHWMKRKGITPLTGDLRKSAALIRKKIMRSGIPPQPFLFRSFERHRQTFINRMLALFNA